MSAPQKTSYVFLVISSAFIHALPKINKLFFIIYCTTSKNLKKLVFLFFQNHTAAYHTPFTSPQFPTYAFKRICIQYLRARFCILLNAKLDFYIINISACIVYYNQ